MIGCMLCEVDNAMISGRTDLPIRQHDSTLSASTYRGKIVVGRLYTGFDGGERDLQNQLGYNSSCSQRTRLGKASCSLASARPPRVFIARVTPPGSYEINRKSRTVGSVSISLPDTPRRSIRGTASGNYSAQLSVAPEAGSSPDTVQHFSSIGPAGGNSVYDHLTSLANLAFLTLSATGDPKQAAGSADSKAPTESSRLTERGSPHPRTHKKKKRGHSGNNRSDDNEDEPGAKVKFKRRRETEGTRLNLACPFAKKDPVRWRSCYRHELSKISYVKQHLYRVHLQPLFCHRCGMTYERQEDLSEHMRSTSACEVQSFTVPEGLTVEQRQRLSERLSSKLSDEQRWYAVFEIVFPGHPHPATPYVDPDMSEDLSSFRDHIAREGPRILVEEYQRAEGTCSPLETTMRRGLEQISSSWFSFRSSYVNQLNSPRLLRSPTSTSPIDVNQTAEAPEDD